MRATAIARFARSFVAWTLGLLLVLQTTSVGAAGSPAKIIVNPTGSDAVIRAEDVARIYLGKKTLWDSGARVLPCLLDEETPAGRSFLDDTLHKSVSQYRAYWKRLLFSGGGAPPPTFRTSAQVLDYVAKKPGAIGVIEASAPTDDRVRVIP
jgi:ABC-type phosphate transport system substrate-binding protein